MRRAEFRDAIRRAGVISGDRDIVIIGSQSIHGAFPPSLLEANLTASIEVDMIPLNDPDERKTWDLSGRGTAYGTEIDGVEVKTASLPEGWLDRLIPYPLNDSDPNTVIAWCLDPHDLAVSKAVAGRSKDWEFIRSLYRAQLVNPALALQRLGQLDADSHQPTQIEVDRAAAFLASLPPPQNIFRSSTRQPPKGRHRPTRQALGYPAPPSEALPPRRTEPRANTTGRSIPASPTPSDHEVDGPTMERGIDF